MFLNNRNEHIKHIFKYIYNQQLYLYSYLSSIPLYVYMNNDATEDYLIFTLDIRKKMVLDNIQSASQDD